MIHLTGLRLLLDKLGSTKLGAEVLTQTRGDMKHIVAGDSLVVRFFTRRRPIDYLAIEVDGPITRELAPSFVYAKRVFTALLCVPVFALTLTGALSPTYYVLVPTRILSAEKYNRMWEFSYRGVELLGQAALCLVLYDLSAYLRYPFFARVLAPLYRRRGWLRPQPKLNLTVEQLRSGAAMRRQGGGGGGAGPPRPLGRPLGEVRRIAKAGPNPNPNPFGKPSHSVAAGPRTAHSAPTGGRPER